MRNLNIIIAIAVLFFCPTPNGHAQMWKKVVKRMDKTILWGIENGLSKGIEETAEQAAEREAKHQLEKLLPAEQSNIEEHLLKAIGHDAVACEPSYTYTSSMRIGIDRTAQGEKPVHTDYLAYFNPQSEGYAFDFADPNRQGEQRLVIYDHKNLALLMLSNVDGQKRGIATTVGRVDSLAISAGIVSQVDSAPTGNTKTIAGHQCHEYRAIGTNFEAVVWVASDIKFDYSKAYNFVGGMLLFAAATPSLSGMVMEQQITDKQTNTVLYLEVKELALDKPTTINLSDYNILGVHQSAK